MATATPGVGPGSGPPTKTPAFKISLNLFGKKYELDLYFERPWLTWLNQIQAQVNNQDDLALLADRGTAETVEALAEKISIEPPPSRSPREEALSLSEQRARIEDFAEKVLALIPDRGAAAGLLMEALYLLAPPAQRNWIDYVMREAGGVVKLEGETAAFPGIRRSTGTPADTQSVLADKSALTGHEVLDEAYGAGWDGKIEVPTKNAVYDKVNALEPRIPSVLPVPVAEGGTGATTAAAARGNLGAAEAQAPGAHSIPIPKLTGGGANGSISWNSEGVITGFSDPT